MLPDFQASKGAVQSTCPRKLKELCEHMVGSRNPLHEGFASKSWHQLDFYFSLMFHYGFSI